MRCSKCGNELVANAAFCNNCGNKVEIVQKRYCGGCGAELQSGIAFCGKCGKPAAVQQQVQPPRMQVQQIQPKPQRKQLPIAVVALIVVIVLFVTALVVYIQSSPNSSGNVFESVTSIFGGKKKSFGGGGGGGMQSQPNVTSAPTEAPQQTAVPMPVFTYVTVSSIRGTDTEGGQYSADAVLDLDPMTKWVPAKEIKNGISEWVQINAAQEQYVNGIMILNGYHKSAEIWKNNNRVMSCTLTFSNGQTKNLVLEDTMDLISIDFDAPIKTSYIRLTINSVYGGTKWDDTAITYLSAY